MADVVAINVDQPYASLLAHGIKGWETRPNPPAGWPGIPEGTRRMPGCRITPDTEVLIVASKRPPRNGAGGWYADKAYGEWRITKTIPASENGGLFASYSTIWLPLGAVLGVGRVLDVLPIVDDYDDVCHDDVYHACGGPAAIEHQDGELWLWPEWDSALDDEPADISDQLPYGDWSPGRWAWRMEVRQLAEPLSTWLGVGVGGSPCYFAVRGRQGAWRPDPALVAAVQEAPDAR